MSEIWNGPGNDWYPGDDDDETNADGDRYDETPVEGLFPDIPDTLIRQGIYAAGDSGDPDDHPPTYEEDPSFYDDDEDFKLDQAEAAGIDRDAAREALYEYTMPDEAPDHDN